jgi:hypothetical protein
LVRREKESTDIANTPSDGALFTRSGAVVGLTVDTQVHDMVAADGAIVDDDVPCPESDGIPLWKKEVLSALSCALPISSAHVSATLYLLDLESFLSISVAGGGCDFLALGSSGGSRVGHFDVRHLCKCKWVRSAVVLWSGLSLQIEQ